MYNVFVYGTLKRGEPNHHLLENKEGAKFHSNATTVESYPLVVATKYNVPFLLDRPGQGNVVQGEVYRVTDSVLADLDDLEDHPVLYVRREEQVQLDNDERLTCWIYLLPRFRDEFMRLPFLKCYRNAEHPLKYVTRSDRTSAKSLHDFVLP